MRIVHFSLPIFVITSLLLLSACSSSDLLGSKKSYEPRSWISDSGKYVSGSGSYRRWNREKPGSENNLSDVPKISPASWANTLAPSPVPAPTSTGSAQDIQKTVSYNTPWGPVGITFSLSLDADKAVTAINATMNSGEHESQQYVRRFTNKIGQYVIGKKINSLSLDTVGWASLTTWAFNQVIQSL